MNIDDVQEQAQVLTKKVTDSSPAVSHEQKQDVLQPNKPNIVWASAEGEQKDPNAIYVSDTPNKETEEEPVVSRDSFGANISSDKIVNDSENRVNITEEEGALNYLGGRAPGGITGFKNVEDPGSGTMFLQQKYEPVKPFEFEFNGKKALVDTLNKKKALYELDAFYGEDQDPYTRYFGYDRQPAIDREGLITGTARGLVNLIPSMIIQIDGAIDAGSAFYRLAQAEKNGDNDAIEAARELLNTAIEATNSSLSKWTFAYSESGDGANEWGEGLGNLIGSMVTGAIGGAKAIVMMSLAEAVGNAYQTGVYAAERGVGGYEALGLMGASGAATAAIGSSTAVVGHIAHSAFKPGVQFAKMMRNEPNKFVKMLGGEKVVTWAWDGATEPAQDIVSKYIGSGELTGDDWDQAAITLMQGLIVGGGISAIQVANGKKTYKKHFEQIDALFESWKPKIEALCNQEGSPYTMETFEAFHNYLKQGHSVDDLATFMKETVIANVDRITGSTVSDDMKKQLVKTLKGLSTDGALNRSLETVDKYIDNMLEADSAKDLTSGQRDMFRMMMRGIAINNLVYRGIMPDAWMGSAQRIMKRGVHTTERYGETSSVIGSLTANGDKLTVDTAEATGLSQDFAMTEGKDSSSESVSNKVYKQAKRAIQKGNAKTNTKGTIAAGAMRHEMAHFLDMFSGLSKSADFVKMLEGWVKDVFPNILKGKKKGSVEYSEAIAYAFQYADSILKPLGLEGQTRAYMNMFLSVAQANSFSETYKKYLDIVGKAVKENRDLIEGLLDPKDTETVNALREFAKTGNKGVIDKKLLDAIYKSIQTVMDAETAKKIKDAVGGTNIVSFLDMYKKQYGDAVAVDKMTAEMYAKKILGEPSTDVETGLSDVSKAIDKQVEEIKQKEEASEGVTEDQEVVSETPEGQSATEEGPVVKTVEELAAESDESDESDEGISDWQQGLEKGIRDEASLANLYKAYGVPSVLYKYSAAEEAEVIERLDKILEQDSESWGVIKRADENANGRIVEIAVGISKQAKEYEEALRKRYGSGKAERILAGVAKNMFLKKNKILNAVSDFVDKEVVERVKERLRSEIKQGTADGKNIKATQDLYDYLTGTLDAVFDVDVMKEDISQIIRYGLIADKDDSSYRMNELQRDPETGKIIGGFDENYQAALKEAYYKYNGNLLRLMSEKVLRGIKDEELTADINTIADGLDGGRSYVARIAAQEKKDFMAPSTMFKMSEKIDDDDAYRFEHLKDLYFPRDVKEDIDLDYAKYLQAAIGKTGYADGGISSSYAWQQLENYVMSNTDVNTLQRMAPKYLYSIQVPVTDQGRTVHLFNQDGTFNRSALEEIRDRFTRKKWGTEGQVISAPQLMNIVLDGITDEQPIAETIYVAKREIDALYEQYNSDLMDSLRIKNTLTDDESFKTDLKWARERSLPESKKTEKNAKYYNLLNRMVEDLVNNGYLPQDDMTMIQSYFTPTGKMITPGLTFGDKIAIVHNRSLRECVVIQHNAYANAENETVEDSYWLRYKNKEGKTVDIRRSAEEIRRMIDNDMPVLFGGKVSTEEQKAIFDGLSDTQFGQAMLDAISQQVVLDGSLTHMEQYEYEKESRGEKINNGVYEATSADIIDALKKSSSRLQPTEDGYVTDILGRSVLLTDEEIERVGRFLGPEKITSDTVAFALRTLGYGERPQDEFSTVLGIRRMKKGGVPTFKQMMDTKLGGKKDGYTLKEFLDIVIDALKKKKITPANVALFFMTRAVGWGSQLRNLVGEKISRILGLDLMADDAQRKTESIKRDIQRILTTKVFDGSLSKMVSWTQKTSVDLPNIKAKTSDGQERAISKQEIMSLYLAKVCKDEFEAKENRYAKTKEGLSIDADPISPLNGGSIGLWKKLNETITNIDELLEVLTEEDKDAVIKGLRGSNVTVNNGKIYIPVADFTTLNAGGWGSRRENARMVYGSNITDESAHIYVMPLYDSTIKMASKRAIENSNFISAMKKIKMLFDMASLYENTREDIIRDAVAERFKKEFKMADPEVMDDRTASNQDIADADLSQNIDALVETIQKAKQMKALIEAHIGTNNLDSFLRLLTRDSDVENSYIGSRSIVGKTVEKLARGVMASVLWLKPKSAVFNSYGNYAIFSGLSGSGGMKYMTSDFMDAVLHTKEAWKLGMSKEFLKRRFENAGMSDQFERLSDIQQESLLTDISNYIEKHKFEKPADFLRGFDNWSKTVTKYGIGITNTLPDFLGICWAYYAVNKNLTKMATEELQSSGLYQNISDEMIEKTKDDMFHFYLLEHISNSNYLTRGLTQKKLAESGLLPIFAFTTDTLLKSAQLSNAITELINTEDPVARKRLWKEITGIVNSSAIYVAVQAGLLGAVIRLITGDDLDEDEWKELYSSLLRESAGQVASMFQYGNLLQDVIDGGIFGSNGGLNIMPLQQIEKIFASAAKGDFGEAFIETASDTGAPWVRRISEIISAIAQYSGSERTEDDLGVLSSVLYGRTEKTAMRKRNLRKTSSGEYKKIKHKKKEEVEEDE